MKRLLCALAVMSGSVASDAGPAPAPAKMPAPAKTLAPAKAPAALAFVPDAIANQIGSASLVGAIDLRRFSIEPFVGMIADSLGCLRDIARSAHVVVVTAEPFVVYATGVQEPNVWRCLRGIASLSSADSATQNPDGSIEFQENSVDVIISWNGGVAAVRTNGTQVPSNAPPSAVLRALAARVPADAFGFAVGTKLDTNPPLDSFAMSIRTVAADWLCSVHAQSAQSGGAQKWMTNIVEIFKEIVATRNIKVDDAWIKQTSAGSAASLDLRFPIAVLSGAPPAGAAP